MFLLVRSLVYLVLSICELLVALRIILMLLAASASASFVAWVYGTSEHIVRPFVGIFPSPFLGIPGLETAALIALIVIAIIAWIVGYAFSLPARRHGTEV